jgi:hypothetical protein
LFIYASRVLEQLGLHWLVRHRQVLGAAVKVRADLVRMLRAEMPITRLAGLRYVVALETARRAASGDRASMHALSSAGADNS